MSWDDEQELGYEYEYEYEVPTRRDYFDYFWIRFNIAAAIGLVVFATFNPWNVYQRFLGHSFIAVLLVAAGLPALAFLIHRLDGGGRQVALTWAVTAGVLLLFVARTAVLDAHLLHFENCWKIGGNDTASTWECAPGRSHPAEWNPGENTSGNYCDEVNTSSSGGTIWRCESG